jgi:hypothetical protein
MQQQHEENVQKAESELSSLHQKLVQEREVREKLEEEFLETRNLVILV